MEERNRNRIKRVTNDIDELDGRVTLYDNPPEGQEGLPWYLNAQPVTRATARNLIRGLLNTGQSIHSPQCYTLWVLADWVRHTDWILKIEPGYTSPDNKEPIFWQASLEGRKWEGCAPYRYAQSHLFHLRKELTDEDREIFLRWHEDLTVACLSFDCDDAALMDKLVYDSFVWRQIRDYGPQVRRLIAAFRNRQGRGHNEAVSPEDVKITQNSTIVELDTLGFYAVVSPLHSPDANPPTDHRPGFQVCTQVCIPGGREQPDDYDEVSVGPQVANLWEAASLAIKLIIEERAREDYLALIEGSDQGFYKGGCRP